MLKGFEDAFVDAQANVISLCLELLKNSEKSADVIYVYILQNDDEEYIDAFFEKDGKLFTTNDWCSDAQIKEFFHCGIEDIESIVELCGDFTELLGDDDSTDISSYCLKVLWDEQWSSDDLQSSAGFGRGMRQKRIPYGQRLSDAQWAESVFGFLKG